MENQEKPIEKSQENLETQNQTEPPQTKSRMLSLEQSLLETYKPKVSKSESNKNLEKMGQEGEQKDLSNPFEDERANMFVLVCKTIYISLPNVASFASLWILNFSNLKITEIFKDEDYISAYAMSFMWANALGFALILCLNTGLCAMASQAIGFKKYELVSSFYQRSQVLNFLLISIMAAIMIFTRQIFSTFCTPEVSKYSADFIYGYIPSLFFYIFFDSTRNIFNAHKKFTIPNVLILVTYSIHVGWVYLFMKVLDFRMFGLGLSRSVTEGLNCILLLLIVKSFGLFKNINFWWSSAAFKNWGQYLKLSIPMGSVLYLDWVASDIQTIFVAALKDDDQMSGHSAFVSIFLIYVIFPLGVSITIMSFLGHAIGKGDIEQCKRITRVALACSLVITLTITAISIPLENATADLFTNTEGERKYYKICYKIYTYATVTANGISAIMGAILRASGKQNDAFIAPLLFYFILGIPLQYVLINVVGWGMAGSWVSYTISVYLTGLYFTFMAFRIDWEKQCEVVQKNINDQMALVFGSTESQLRAGNVSSVKSQQDEEKQQQQQNLDNSTSNLNQEEKK